MIAVVIAEHRTNWNQSNTAVDLDSDLLRIQSGQRIRIRIQEGKNDSLSDKNIKKLRISYLKSAGCSLLRAAGLDSLWRPRDR